MLTLVTQPISEQDIILVIFYQLVLIMTLILTVVAFYHHPKLFSGAQTISNSNQKIFFSYLLYIIIHRYLFYVTKLSHPNKNHVSLAKTSKQNHVILYYKYLQQIQLLNQHIDRCVKISLVCYFWTF